MNLKKFANLLFLVLYMVSLVSCNKTHQPEETLLQLTITPIPSNTVLDISTPTSVSALSINEATILSMNLLASNGDCNLPCVWGMTSGQSTIQDSQNILAPLKNLASYFELNSNPSGISLNSIEEDLIIYISINLYSSLDNSVIDWISFKLRALSNVNGEMKSIFNSTEFAMLSSKYRLSQVLNSFKEPEAAIISTWNKAPSRGQEDGFQLILIYPDNGIAVRYITNWQEVNSNILGCFSSAHVEMEIFPSNNSELFTSLMSQSSNWEGLWPEYTENPYWKSLADATSMSLQEFYETFRESTDECIETPANLWPTPER